MNTLRLPQTQARIVMKEGQTVLEAALDGGVQFPHSCRSGRCGACKSQLLSGEVTMLQHSPFALDAAERIAGNILACRAEYLRLARTLWIGNEPLSPEPLPDREIFELLGFD